MPSCSKAMRQLMKTTLFRVIAFVLLASLGGLLFSEVERPSAESRSKTKKESLESLHKEMENKYNMTQEDFDNFIDSSSEALSLDGPVWNYFDGLRYTFETLTTIGYGALAPSTSLGQILCMVFAVLGIPLTILAFKSVGELISLGISSAIAFIESKCCKREPTNIEAKCTVATCLLMITMLLLGATLQTDTDEWSFLEGFYFWFITLTTIGYGDYIAGHETSKKGNGGGKKAALSTLNLTFHIAWTTCGLCVVSSVLNAVAAFIEKPRSPAERRCGKHCSCFSDGQKESEAEMGETREKESYRGGIGNGRDKIERRDEYNCVTYV